MNVAGQAARSVYQLSAMFKHGKTNSHTDSHTPAQPCAGLHLQLERETKIPASLSILLLLLCLVTYTANYTYNAFRRLNLRTCQSSESSDVEIR